MELHFQRVNKNKTTLSQHVLNQTSAELSVLKLMGLGGDARGRWGRGRRGKGGQNGRNLLFYDDAVAVMRLQFPSVCD